MLSTMVIMPLFSFASLDFYEGFNYSTGNLATVSGTWIASATAVVSSTPTPSLQPVNFPSLLESGNHAEFQPVNSGGNRNLASVAIKNDLLNATTVNGAQFWMSFVAQFPTTDTTANFVLQYGGGSGEFIELVGASSALTFRTVAGGSAPVFNAGTGNRFFASSITNTGGLNPVATLYMPTGPNVIDLGAPVAGPINISVFSNADNPFMSATGGPTQTLFLDEIRMGTSYPDVAPVPEPSTFVSMSMGLLMLSYIKWRQRKKKLGEVI